MVKKLFEKIKGKFFSNNLKGYAAHAENFHWKFIDYAATERFTDLIWFLWNQKKLYFHIYLL